MNDLRSAFPAGKFFEKVLPTRKFAAFGYTWCLNPGKFNMKEHMVITIMANVGFSTPYIAYVSPENYISLGPFQYRSRPQNIRWSLFNTSPYTSTNHGQAISVTKVCPTWSLT
jgi:hypothetical protein